VRDLTHIRQAAGAWISTYQKTTLFIITLLVIYGFFPFGIGQYGGIILFWRIGTVILLFLLLTAPLKPKIVTAVEPEGAPEPLAEMAGTGNGEHVEENNIEFIRELSDQFYVKNRRDTEKDFTLFLTRILSIVKKTFAAQTAAIFLLNQHTNTIILKSIQSDRDYNREKTVFEPDQGVFKIVLESSKAYLTNEIEDTVALLPYHDDPGACTSVIASPVFVDKEVIGIIVVDSNERNAFSEDDIQLVETYGGVIAETIVNYNNLFEFENSTRLFSSFYEVSRGLNSNLKFDEILDLLMNILKSVFQYDRITITAYRSKNDRAEVIRVDGQIDDFPEGKVFTLDGGLNGWVIRKQRSLLVSDMEKGDYFMPRYNQQEKSNYGLRSFLAAPIGHHDSCFGAISIESRTQNMYQERHERILVMLANNFGVALERSYVLKQLESLATTDGLTGLYNYRFFVLRLKDEIERALRYKLKFSLLILDLDHFKRINDSYGHPAGDQVLKRVAGAIKTSTRNIDFVTRYGGEEFAVILIETSLADALVTAERIRRSIEELEITYQDTALRITISTGAIEFDGSIKNSDELIACADKALYRAKTDGRNRIIAYKKEFETLVKNKG